MASTSSTARRKYRVLGCPSRDGECESRYRTPNSLVFVRSRAKETPRAYPNDVHESALTPGLLGAECPRQHAGQPMSQPPAQPHTSAHARCSRAAAPAAHASASRLAWRAYRGQSASEKRETGTRMRRAWREGCAPRAESGHGGQRVVLSRILSHSFFFSSGSMPPRGAFSLPSTAACSSVAFARARSSARSTSRFLSS